MEKPVVSIVKYKEPLASVREAIDLASGFKQLKPGSKVFIKPNVVYWNRLVPFPKWGMITTSRVMEDTITLLAEHGVKDITIGEGIITYDPKDRETPVDAWEKLGYNTLAKRFGIKIVNLFERPYKKVDLGCDFLANVSADALDADFLVNIPVLKTHTQAMVSLGIKNLKGLLDMATRKKFHAADPVKNLHFNIAHLLNKIKPALTIIDGIYTLERGPAMNGSAHRKDIIVASTDVLSADLVGSKLLGFDPSTVKHVAIAARNAGRPADLSDVNIVGEPIESLASHHEWEFQYNDAGDLPLPFYKQGMKGIKYRKYDDTMCTYCSDINAIILMGIKFAWDGKPFGDVEVLTGKVMKPTPGMKKTILVGQCIWNACKDNKDIQQAIPIKGCPPSKEALKEAMEKAGIELPDMFYNNLDKGTGLFMAKYRDKPEFDEKFYEIK
ncbi:MAG: DUF362 domain-containing protein [Candidatus Sigynarchaeota archaeon]